MSQLSEKELSVLNDLLTEEDLLIKKFQMLAEQIYTDKEILADALTAEKAATNNYNAFANECVHDSVRDAILHCLEQEHCIQEDVFNMMHQRGLYPTPDADANKVENAKQKFSQCVKTV